MAQEILKSISSLNTITYKLKEEMKETRALIREMKAWQKTVEKAEAPESPEEPKPKAKKEKPEPKIKVQTYRSPEEQAAAYERNKRKRQRRNETLDD